MSLLTQFLYLQFLDFLTTLAFLMNGVREANPIVRFALTAGPHPWVGLALVKVLAVCLALYCIRGARLRLLARVNIFFALLIAWNLVMVILSARSLGLV